jgi:outer membrane scaffolding protein for murein synthesis (MipA/OmpV family)
VDVDPTSIDANDYRAGLDADGVDLGRADLFSASDGGDGGNGMATPSSNTSTAMTGTSVATTTQQGRVQRPTTTTTRKNHKIYTRTSDVWNDFEELFEVVNGKKIRYAARCHYCKKSPHCIVHWWHWSST